MRVAFPKPSVLTPKQMWLRGAALAALATAASVFRAVNPETVSLFLFQTSCGAVTGLPCLLCGMTRALHHLLRGDVLQALYFNWLAFPLAGLTVGLAVLSGAELAARRRLFAISRGFRFTPRTAAFGGGVLLLLWVLQVALAISQGKSELLNAAGPLYSLFLNN